MLLRSLRYLNISELKTRPAVYHSLRTPGWVSWCSALRLRNGDLIVGLNEVIGDLNRQKPEYLPEIRKNAFPNDYYNFIGLENKFKILRATKKEDPWLSQWETYYEESWPGPWPPEHRLLIQTSAGTILREVQGRRLPGKYPYGAISRSEDNGKTWQEYQPVCGMKKFTSLEVSRVIQLNDGSLLMSAYGQKACASGRHNCFSSFILSSNNDGKSWSEPIPVIEGDEKAGYCEPAVVELENGDILMMVRVEPNIKDNPLDAYSHSNIPERNRKQIKLRKVNEKWRPGKVETLSIPHGGHPELLMTKEGILLYISVEGFWGSVNDGKNWTRIETLPDAPYYPHAVQLEDGRIFVTGHNGGDCAYPPPEDMMAWKVSFKIDNNMASQK